MTKGTTTPNRTADAQRMLDAVRNAGIVGAGGAGFPTWKKLDATVEYVIGNGAECEPLLRVDQQLMALYPHEVVRGIEIAMIITGAKNGYIALKHKYKPAIANLTKVLNERAKDENAPPIELFELENFYPAGDEQVMVCEVTGRIVPEGGIPLEVGVVVQNVSTLIQIARAVDNNEPVITRDITVTGEVRKPLTVKVPIGMPLAQLIELAGGATVEPYAAILGGPMMGVVLKRDELSRPVTKVDSGLIVLPEDHYLITVKTAPITVKVKNTMAACIRCNLCTQVCPRNLLGHGIEPDKIMRSVAWGNTENTDVLTGAFLCCECGACTFYGCVMGLDPCKMNKEIKARLWEQGIKNPHHRRAPEIHTHDYRELRKLPLVRLMGRIGVLKYDRPAPVQPPVTGVEKVRVPLKQHIGAPSTPVVKVGQQVKTGQVIAEIPENALGAMLHASISGTVISVVEGDAIEIAVPSKATGGA